MLGAGLIGGAARAQDALEPNTFEEITTYNNFYEFGTGKDDPARNAHTLTTEPWAIVIDGHGRQPGHLFL